MPRRLLTAVVAMALSLGACGDGEGGGPSDETGSSNPGDEATRTPDSGCSNSHPNYLENTGSLAGFFQTCSNDDGTSLTLTNVSSTVLVVRTGGSASLEMTVSEPTTSSFADEMVNKAEPGICSGSNGPCGMPPKAEVTAQDTERVLVLIDLDPISTARATAASLFGSWVAKKLQTRAQSYVGSIAACVNAVGGLTTQGEFLDQTMRKAVAAGGDCTSLVTQVANDLNQNPAPERATDDVLSRAGSFTKNLRRDLYVYKAIRILGALRR